MRSRLVVLAVPVCIASACSFDASGIDGDDGSTPEPDGGSAGHDGSGSGEDAATDAETPACAQGEVELPFDPTNFGPCVPEPQESLVVPASEGWRIDTDEAQVVDLDTGDVIRSFAATATVPQQGQAPELLVVSLDGLELGQNAVLRATGSRALAIVAQGGVAIEAGARFSVGGVGPQPGAGMSQTLCDQQGGLGGDGEQQTFGEEPGGSGGGGGGYGSAGGAGAPVQAAQGDPGPTPGGAAGGDNELAPLRGGCSGGAGFDIGGGESGAAGGGGGALQVVSPQTISVSGAVSASGGGGQPGDQHSGGGGGGSGGAILLEARIVAVSGALTANGGGGGQGMRRSGSAGSCSSPQAGDDGARDTDAPAEGGTSNCRTAGHGGDGDAASANGAEDGAEGDSERSTLGNPPAPAGGGGGGGGMGRIRVAACDEANVDDGVLSAAATVSTDLACSD